MSRGSHSARDERRIDQLQELVTEKVGRGAAFALHQVKVIGHHVHHVVVFTAKGDVHLLVEERDKTQALEAAITKLGGARRKRREKSVVKHGT